MKWSWQIIGAGLRSYGSPIALTWFLGVEWISLRTIGSILGVGTAFFLISWANKVKWRDAAKAAREAAF